MCCDAESKPYFLKSVAVFDEEKKKAHTIGMMLDILCAVECLNTFKDDEETMDFFETSDTIVYKMKTDSRFLFDAFCRASHGCNRAILSNDPDIAKAAFVHMMSSICSFSRSVDWGKVLPKKWRV